MLYWCCFVFRAGETLLPELGGGGNKGHASCQGVSEPPKSNCVGHRSNNKRQKSLKAHRQRTYTHPMQIALLERSARIHTPTRSAGSSRVFCLALLYV